MWTSAPTPCHCWLFFPHAVPENLLAFPQELCERVSGSGFACGFHRKCGKPCFFYRARFFYFLLLMLVVISLTFSAKAGSERIRLSTFSSECMMVE